MSGHPATVDPTARDCLVQLGRRVAAAGLSSGQSGNISLRVGDVVVMSPTNSELADLDPNRLALVSVDGVHLGGPKPSKEVPLHLALYRRDARGTAVVHVHSAHAVALSCREPWAAHCAIPPMTPYFLMKIGQVPLIPYFAPGDPRQAQLVEKHPLTFSAALLANHGQIAVGASASAALNAAVEIEEVARTVLLQPDASARLLDAHQIEELVARDGRPWQPGLLDSSPSGNG